MQEFGKTKYTISNNTFLFPLSAPRGTTKSPFWFHNNIVQPPLVWSTLQSLGCHAPDVESHASE